MDAFEKKVARAIKLLQSIPQDGEIEVSYSGGKDSDVILVMKDGNIIEQGRHEELLSKKDFYYELYSSQFAERD